MKHHVEMPRLKEIFVEEIDRLERGVTGAMDETAAAVKQSMRQDIRKAGLGQRLANTIRSRRYPQHTHSMNAAALVWTNAPKIIEAFEEGATIHATEGGMYLAIPLPAAGKGLKGRKITPEEWERRNGIALRFVYRDGKPPLLVADGRVSLKGKGRIKSHGLAKVSRSRTGRGRATVPVFVLKPQVRLAKRLNLKGAVDREASKIGDRIFRRL